MTADGIDASVVTPRETLTRHAVVEAARNHIVDHGLQSLSLRRVGSSLGVTAPALYAYVHDKRDMLRAVAETAFEDLLGEFDRVEVPDPVDRLRALSRVYIRYSLDNPELFRTMFLFPPALDLTPATGDELPLATQAFNYAAGAIRDAQESGQIRADIDPLMVTFTTWTATHGLASVLNLGFEFDDATRELLIEHVLDTVVGGLRP